MTQTTERPPSNSEQPVTAPDWRESEISLSIRNGIAYLTMQAPPLNILTAARMRAISSALAKVAASREVLAVAVTAEGKAFSAGADIGEHHPEQAPEMIAAFSEMFRRFEALEVPVVMLVEGAALGGGFELALMADVLLATEKASFGQPEIRLGFIAPVGIAALPQRVGRGRAIEITASGRKYSAAEMERYGLVTRLVSAEGATQELEAVLDDFRKASPLIMRMNVRTLKRVAHKPFDQARCEAERVFLKELMPTEDVREGLAAFEEKREPAWRNR